MIAQAAGDVALSMGGPPRIAQRHRLIDIDADEKMVLLLGHRQGLQ
jgi:hypothetical protein